MFFLQGIQTQSQNKQTQSQILSFFVFFLLLFFSRRKKNKAVCVCERELELRAMEVGSEMRQSRFKSICVFCGSSQGKKSSYQDSAIELGKELVYICSLFFVYLLWFPLWNVGSFSNALIGFLLKFVCMIWIVQETVLKFAQPLCLL